ncbi:DUF3592 domain-containing protein [Actinomadura miaoliensis]
MHRLRFRRSAVPTRGVVIGSREERTHDGSGGSFELEIRYRVPDGREFTFKEGGQSRHHDGAVVRVLYDPSRPENAHLEFTAARAWVESAVLLVLGAVVTWLVIFVWQPWSQ